MATGGPSGGSIDVTVTNPAGTGSAHLVGTATKTQSALTTAVDITFNKWTDAESKITLDGALHETGTFAEPLPLSGNVELSGALTASGPVSGAVDFDVKGNYSPSGFSVSGNVGGQSVSATLNVAAH
jgi:hypothetical protein